MLAACRFHGKVEPIFLRDIPAFQIIPELEPLPGEGFVDKITMSAFEGTYLGIALRDCEIRSFIIATCRQGADLGLWPILVRDACGFGNEEAANHSLASLKHIGDTKVSQMWKRSLDCWRRSLRGPSSRFRFFCESCKSLHIHRGRREISVDIQILETAF